MESPKDRYLREHATPVGEALGWIERQSHIRTNYPQMVSGPVQGRFLSMMVSLTGASRVLEIGCFTGYSTVCLAMGLPDGGSVDTLEVNDELEDLIREGFSRAGVSDRINLYIGDALEVLSSLPGPYDLVFIDADKRQYAQYYEMCLERLRPGGCMIVDDVLWDDKFYGEDAPRDAQSRSLSSFNDMVAKDRRVEVVILPLRDGLSVIRKI